MSESIEGDPLGRPGQRSSRALETRVLRLSDSLTALGPAVLRRLLSRPLEHGAESSPRAAASIASTMAWLALVAGVGLVVTQLGQEILLGDPVRMFDADEEANFWAWTHVAALLAATGAVALLSAWAGVRGSLWFAAATLLFLSADEFLEIHGRIADTLVFFPHAGRVIWPAMYFPLLAALLIVLWRAVEPHDDRARAMVRGGLLLLSVAVLLELASLGVFVVADGFGLLYNLEVGLEEGAEVAGWLLIAGGFASVVLSGVTEPTQEPTQDDHEVEGE